MKIIVYAISKNEEKFVDRWYESMKEADDIYVLDTGSTDDTVKLLKEKGVKVNSRVIDPWRFDVARNLSLSFVSEDADICVCTDLDEVFVPGWRRNLEKIWKSGTNRVRYIYNWKLKDNKPIITFYGEKIHSRSNFEWVNPVHEILSYNLGTEKIITSDNIVLNHYPDDSKSRRSYLPLLELSIKENPQNDRNMHYLGREYMYYSKWNECIDTLIKHLNLPSAKWKDERCASMRFIGRSYIKLKRYDEARLWLEKAILEAPYLRETYMEMAFLEYELGNYLGVVNNCTKALTIKKNNMTYINEEFCEDCVINDLLSVAYYDLKLYDMALICVDKALKFNENDSRLIENREMIIKKNNKD